jgi:DNA replication protein DnaC
LKKAREFVEGYPPDIDGQGLLLVGSFGVGKTHLAASILRELILHKDVRGIFCDYRSLLKQIQDSYGRSDVSERQILAPIFDADVLVLDELGAAKPTDWVWDTVQHILNTRYNDRKATIITTNYRNERELPMGYWDELPKDKRDAVKAMYRDNLGDRITERMRSRLLEMCAVIEMEGPDFRERLSRAIHSVANGHGADIPTENAALKIEIARAALEKEAEDRIFRETHVGDASASVTEEITGARSLARYAGK